MDRDGPGAMETDPDSDDDVKEDLRTVTEFKLFMFKLRQDLKRLEYVGVAEIDRFLSSTFEHPLAVKASFMPESTQVLGT